MFKWRFGGFVLSILMSGSAHAACPTFPYTFSNGSTADASQVNSNFTNVTTCFAPLAGPSFTGNVSLASGVLVTSAGYLEVGSTPTRYNVGLVSVQVVPGTSQGIAFQQTADTSSPTPLIFFNSSGGAIGTVITTSSSTAYNTSSDRRLKENIQPSGRGLDAVLKIPVNEFNFNNDPKKSRVQGLIAQEVYKIYPEAVSVGGDNPKLNPWGIDYGRLTPLIMKAMQEQQVQIEALKTEVAALKSAKPAAH